MRKLVVLFFFLSQMKLGFAQNFYISGKVTNIFSDPLANAGVFVKNSSFFTYTNDTGYYKILVPKGTFTLVIEKKGFKTYSTKLTLVNQDVHRNFNLDFDQVENLGAVKVTSKKVDRSKSIIRAVIDGKGRFKDVSNYSMNAFVVASVQNQFQKFDSLLKKKVKDTSQHALAQVFLNIDVGEDGKIREERVGVKKQGDQSLLYWLSATDGWVNIYDNLIKMDEVCEVPIISPISNTGYISYRFKMEEIWLEDFHLMYKISFRPMKLGNALGNGYLIIEDSTYYVHKAVMHLPSMHLPEYNRFAMVHHYAYPTDSMVLLKKQEFKYKAKFGENLYHGSTQVDFDSFQFQQTYAKRHFGPMLSLTSKKAYEQDSNFWETVRTKELTVEEALYERKQDSIRAVIESVSYKDSMQRDFNKVTFKKVVLLGQGNYNHKKERLFYVQPLLFSYQPVMIAGARVSTWASYTKQYEDKKMLRLFPNASFGFRNNDIKGGVGGYYLFDPIHRKSISWNIQRDFDVINPFDAWVNLFRRSNFFEADDIVLNYRQELTNGLFVTVGVGYSNRKSISKYDFNPLGDSLFLAWGDSNRNKAVQFEPYRALYNYATVSYTPGQKYMLEPYQKVILGSKWPTFGMKYEKGISGPLNSTVDYDFLEFDIQQRLKLGLLGRMNYRFNTGKFIQMRDLRLADYVFQPNSNPYLFTNPNHTFQRLDSVYKTFDWFFEGHVLHRFNGAILNKIPLLKKAQMVETLGAGVLFSPENDLRYIEAFVGLEKVIKILEERFRLGVYLVGAQSNRFEAPLRLKFSIEYFNRQDNTWMF
jgi:hypothetical protein